eukprot:scaffold24970_cov34-Attheya_sp.AAC.4
MLPLLILVVPPSVVGGSYWMWYQGQQFVLRQWRNPRDTTSMLQQQQQQQIVLSNPNPTSTSIQSFAAGGVAWVGAYGLQSKFLFPFFQDTTKTETTTTTKPTAKPKPKPTTNTPSLKKPPHTRVTTILPNKKQPLLFVPPKNMSELFHRAGRPVLLRLGAICVSFFCAGAAQTYASLPPSPSAPQTNIKPNNSN